MTRWEYAFRRISPDGSWRAALSEMGLEGWEAWNVETDARGWRVICFKRPIVVVDPHR